MSENLTDKVVAQVGDKTVRRTLRANATQEAVSGTDRTVWLPYIHSLPEWIDDVDRDFPDIYREMLKDPVIVSSLEAVKRATLANGIKLNPAITDKKDKRFNKSAKVRDFCQQALDGMQEPIEQVAYDMLSALEHGNSRAEIVMKEEGGLLTLDRLKVKPRRVLAFVMDAYSNLLGFCFLKPGEYRPLYTTEWLGKEALDRLLPRSKIWLMTWKKQHGDPRGQSILRAAYTPWEMKRHLYPEMMRYAAQFGSPSIVGKVGPTSAETQVVDPNTGQIEKDDQGNDVYGSAKQALLRGILAFRNGYGLVIDGDQEVDILQAASNGDTVFQSMLGTFDKQIVTAILLQTRATMEAEHGSRADSQTGQDTLQLLVQGVKGMVEDSLRRDVLMTLLEVNNMDTSLCPFVSLAETADNDFATDAEAIARLYASGFFTPSQIKALAARLGVEPPTDAEIAIMTQAFELKAVPVNPDGQQHDGTGKFLPVRKDGEQQGDEGAGDEQDS